MHFCLCKWQTKILTGFCHANIYEIGLATETSNDIIAGNGMMLVLKWFFIVNYQRQIFTMYTMCGNLSLNKQFERFFLGTF